MELTAENQVTRQPNDRYECLNLNLIERHALTDQQQPEYRLGDIKADGNINKQAIYYKGTQIGWLRSNNTAPHLYDPKHDAPLREFLENSGLDTVIAAPTSAEQKEEAERRKRIFEKADKPLPAVNTAELLGFDEIFGQTLNMPEAVVPIELDEYDPAISAIAKFKQVEDEQNYHPSKFLLALGAYVISSEGKEWYKGVKGIRTMGRRLKYLQDRGYLVLHSIPIDHTDIDHLVVSPSGAFYSISTKNVRGKTVWVSSPRFHISGHNQDFIYDSETEARRVAERVEDIVEQPSVTPIIAVVNSSKLTVAKQPTLVRVMKGNDVALYILKQEQARNKAQENDQFNRKALDDPRFWVDTPYTPYPQAELLAWFNTVERRQRRANQRRTIFGATCLVIIGATGTWVAGLLNGWWT